MQCLWHKTIDTAIAMHKKQCDPLKLNDWIDFVLTSNLTAPAHRPVQFRTFTSTPTNQSWLFPKKGAEYKAAKGRPRVATGGSVRGTTVVWGDYGLRMIDKHRRISSAHLRIAEETIKKRLRGTKYRLYHRVAANVGVYTSGNDQRMGKGKGTFDHWATRVAVSRILFELKGDIHEQVVRDAFRLAGNKLPGMLTSEYFNEIHSPELDSCSS